MSDKLADFRPLYRKFNVERVDGSSGPGCKHEHCEYFVLDLAHDRHAGPALRAYARVVRDVAPILAQDLFRLARNLGEKLSPSEEALAMRADERNGGVKLTKRQREVLRWMAEGYVLRRHVTTTVAEMERDRMVFILRSTLDPLEKLGLIACDGQDADCYSYYSITDAGRKALAERGEGAEVSH